MVVLFNSSRPSQCHMSDDGFCIVDDRSCTSFATKYRSACYPRTASSLYHSGLLVICRLGHVRNANHQWSLPTTGNKVKANEGSGKAKHKSDGLSALSATASVPGRSICCSSGTQKSDNVLTSPIHESQLGARAQPLGSLTPGDAANVDSKPRMKSASLGDKQKGAQKKPLEESVQDRHMAESRREELKLSFSSFEDNINAADVPLPPSPSPMLLVDRSKGRNHGPAATAGRFEKRQRDDSDDEIKPNPVHFKKVMRRTLKITVSTQQHDARVLLLEILAKPCNRLSTFEVARED